MLYVLYFCVTCKVMASLFLSHVLGNYNVVIALYKVNILLGNSNCLHIVYIRVTRSRYTYFILPHIKPSIDETTIRFKAVNDTKIKTSIRCDIGFTVI